MQRGKRPNSIHRGGRSRLEEMRALAHPLRLRLMEMFADRPRTTMQVAAILNMPPTRLYHHVHALERAGLLHLRETRRKRGTHEKYFEIPESVRANGLLRARHDGRGRGGRTMAALAAAALGAAQLELASTLAGPRRPRRGGKSLIARVQIPSRKVAVRIRKGILTLLHQELALRKRIAGRARKASAEAGGHWSLTVLLLPPGARSSGAS